MVPGPRRIDSSQWGPVSTHGPVTREYRRSGSDVQGVAGSGSKREADAERAWPEALIPHHPKKEGGPALKSETWATLQLLRLLLPDTTAVRVFPFLQRLYPPGLRNSSTSYTAGVALEVAG